MNFINAIGMFMLIFALCGCSSEETAPPTPEPSVIIIETVPEPSDVSVPEDESPNEAPAPSESAPAELPAPGVTVTLYRGDDQAEKLLPQEATLPELSPQAILDKLMELAVFSEAIPVNSFTVDNYNVIQLDLGESFKTQINAMGTSGEYIMMGSLVNSFLDAFEADSLRLKINGEDLETGHNVYDYDLTRFQ